MILTIFTLIRKKHDSSASWSRRCISGPDHGLILRHNAAARILAYGSGGFIKSCATTGWKYMMSSNGNIFRVTGLLCGKFTGHRWIPPHKRQWRGTLMFCLICAWMNGLVNNRKAGDLRRRGAHYDVTVMIVTASDRCSITGPGTPFGQRVLHFVLSRHLNQSWFSTKTIPQDSTQTKTCHSFQYLQK